ncbi:DUF1178 family protein [Glaciimonas immobilis]|uniref:DUF1178 family protein n=1 Tax=Glaciimonas immobilis TaxID=728004 RepID=A0A840RNW4_9BURK|nr:DUF1178 family protein [Glaciimonas immobilis]KAF3998927.1 DUF1178 family protein [Glaciimonas immobilis]MBB5198331.1 hypothetical protein [Glaciimonas immobilis]
MKVYNLGCDKHHCFEGWFSSEQDFLAQSERLQIACPTCESLQITKLPSAPHLNLSQGGPSVPAAPAASSEMAMTRESAFIKMAQYVLKNTEDVGERFTEEARRMHYNEVPHHAIRGTASASQREALTEEGIDVVELPLPIRSKQSLQ